MTPDKKIGPILMTGTNVLAILKGRKTQTRRIMKPQPSEDWTPETWGEVHKMHNGAFVMRKGEPVVVGWGPSDVWGAEAYKSPYGKPGDRLWVRETFRYSVADDCAHYESCNCKIGTPIYRATCGFDREEKSDPHWKPSIFMPRAASRITLEIVGFRVERLNDISEEDAVAEGIEPINNIGPCRVNGWKDYSGRSIGHMSPIKSYQSLWKSTNGACPWTLNPWVWVIEFKRV